MAGLATWAPIVISFFALLVAFIAFRRTSEQQEQNNEFQRRLVEVEEKREQDRRQETRKALVTIESLRKGDHWFIVAISNVGKSPACDVTYELNGKPLHEAGDLLNRPVMLPKLLPPGYSYSHDMSVSNWFIRGQLILRISWHDESSEPGICEAVVATIA